MSSDLVRLVDVSSVLRVLEDGVPRTIADIAKKAHTPEGEVRKILLQLCREDLVRVVDQIKFGKHR